jgi:serine phosphatase RsbU (regulator of sigma subunit)
MQPPLAGAVFKGTIWRRWVNMTVSDLEHFRDLLEERRQSLAQLLDTPRVTTDGDRQQVQALLAEIKAALGRIENESYGTCVVCHGEVELHRLEVQPVREVCLSCITAEEQSQLEYDLFLASKIHRALLPQAIDRIEGFDIAVKSMAAHAVGGDYYDFLTGGDRGALRIVIADVMGKGISAGLLMSNIQGALRILAEDIPSTCQLIHRLNRWLCRNIPMTKFVSLACVSIEPQNDSHPRITYANAGHCPPILVHADGKIQYLNPTGGILGVHEGFHYEERNCEVIRGDLLVMYTDGITEAENDKGEMFGEERLAGLVLAHRSKSPKALLEEIWSEIRKFSCGQEPSDDQTVIALRRL